MPVVWRGGEGDHRNKHTHKTRRRRREAKNSEERTANGNEPLPRLRFLQLSSRETLTAGSGSLHLLTAGHGRLCVPEVLSGLPGSSPVSILGPIGSVSRSVF